MFSYQISKVLKLLGPCSSTIAAATTGKYSTSYHSALVLVCLHVQTSNAKYSHQSSVFLLQHEFTINKKEKCKSDLYCSKLMTINGNIEIFAFLLFLI